MRAPNRRVSRCGPDQTGTLPVVLEPTEVSRLIEDASGAFLNTNGCRPVTIDVAPGLPLVMADRRRIVRVIDTIVSTTSRLSDGSASLHIRAERDGGHVQISVIDPGRRVPAERLADLFKRVPRFPPADATPASTTQGWASPSPRGPSKPTAAGSGPRTTARAGGPDTRSPCRSRRPPWPMPRLPAPAGHGPRAGRSGLS